MSDHRLKDLTGARFGKLLVVRRVKSDGRPRWLCLCSCGTWKENSSNALNSGHAKSCGCLMRESGKTHGMYRTKEHTSWASMVMRCTNKRSDNYKYYGGRGIRVCDRWRNFENFYADMGKAPSGTTLDRIDSNKDYCKENCRWATAKEQARNKRSNHVVSANGETRCIAEWADILGVNVHTLHSRVHLGWDDEMIINTPIRKRAKNVSYR